MLLSNLALAELNVESLLFLLLLGTLILSLFTFLVLLFLLAGLLDLLIEALQLGLLLISGNSSVLCRICLGLGSLGLLCVVVCLGSRLLLGLVIVLRLGVFLLLGHRLCILLLIVILCFDSCFRLGRLLCFRSSFLILGSRLLFLGLFSLGLLCGLCSCRKIFIKGLYLIVL